MRATWAIWVGASLAVLGWWSRLPAAGRILTVAEGREILGDAFALGIARAERALDARRASGETSAAGGGASVSSLVVIQVGYEETDGQNVILWAWDLSLTPSDQEYIYWEIDGELLKLVQNGTEYVLYTINKATILTILPTSGTHAFRVLGENDGVETSALDTLEVLSRPPFSEPAIASCGPGPRDPTTGKCSLAIEWTNPAPPHWYSFFSRAELGEFRVGGEDDPYGNYVKWLDPGKGVLATDAHGEQTFHVIPGFAPGRACAYMAGWWSEDGNDYLGRLQEVCCLLSCPDGGCDGPFVRRIASNARGAADGTQEVLVSFHLGEERYSSIRATLDGVDVPRLSGTSTELFLPSVEPGVHELVLVGECGAAGTSSPSRWQFHVVPEGISASPPSEVQARFVDEAYARITVTWTNAGEPLVHEVFLVEEDGSYRHIVTVAARATGANIEGTREGQRVAVLSFYQAGRVSYYSEPVVVEPAPPPRTRFLRGDCDGNDTVVLTDAIFALNRLFKGGSESPCVVGCDSNSDGRDDIADAVFTLNHLFLGGPQPEGPYPECEEAPEDQRPSCPVSTCRR